MKRNAIILVVIGAIVYMNTRCSSDQRDSSMQTVTSKDGTAIAYEKSGTGPAVILVVVVGALATHSDQYSFILKGSVQATIGDTVIIIKAGEAVVIPPNVPHSFKSLADGTIDLDFFAPRREDRINGTADYFKK